MSYMDDFERDLAGVLENAPDQKTVINFVKNKMLESYRNGIAAAKKQPPGGGNRSFARNPRRGFSPSKGQN
jgi:hypothetical protein